MSPIDIQILIMALLFGFAAGYVTRELVSRRRRKRWRQTHWYWPVGCKQFSVWQVLT